MSLVCCCPSVLSLILLQNTNSTLDTADKALCFANFNDGGSGSGYVYHFVFLILASLP